MPLHRWACLTKGQERGLRPGTLPVALIAGLGKAAEIASKTTEPRLAKCRAIKAKAMEAFLPLNPSMMFETPWK